MMSSRPTGNPSSASPPPSPSLALLRRLFGLIRPFRGNFWLVNVLTVLFIAAEVLELRLIGAGLARIETVGHQGSEGSSSFWQAILNPPTAFLAQVRLLAGLILALALLRGLLQLSNRLAMAHLGEKVIWRLRSRLVTALQAQSFAYYDGHYTGQIINRVITDVQQLRRMINVVWFTTLQMVINIAGYFVLMFWIHPPLALLATATVPICVWLLLRLARRLRVAFHEARDREDDMVTALQENIAGTEVVKAFAREQAEIDRFDTLTSRCYDRILVIVDLFGRNIPAFRFLVRVNLMLTLGFGGLFVMQGSLRIADLVVFSIAVNVIGTHLRMVVHVTNMTQEALTSSERIFQILDAQPEIRERPHAKPLPAGPGEVVFDNVAFGYQPDRPVLRNINLTIPPGQVVAVVGPTGTGKTSLLNLLPRFYDPTGGRILIDGVDIRKVTLASLRQAIGLVFQETFLFSDTVANNIAFGLPDVDRTEIEEAARVARVDTFIDELDDGYETVIGERGVTLCGGQQQRIAIARALLKNPRILILDDALASVDSATEHAITRELEQVFAGRTVFLVAHRLSTVQRADRVVVLENNTIAAVGTHADLMRTEGHYRQMVELQLGSSSPIGDSNPTADSPSHDL